MNNPRILLLLLWLLLPLPAAAAAADLELPAGFAIEIFAEVPEARQMARAHDGLIYVGSRRTGKVHAVVDSDGDFRADRVIEIASGLKLPSGIAWRDGDLFVAAVDRILRYPAIDPLLAAPPPYELVTDALPDRLHHGWKYIKFGPDGALYVPIGAPCNVCEAEAPLFATIVRADLAVTPFTPEIYALGVRNSVGFAWHPETHELWFTDNGRDLLGDDLPGDELNRAPRAGLHFGFPYVHQGDTPDPEFGAGRTTEEFTPPALTLGPHVAALGMIFYQGAMFPQAYRGRILIAEHGSWNRSEKAGHTGYRVMQVTLEGNRVVDYRPFVSGWLVDNKAWGRPNDLVELSDGSVLVADDLGGRIYRITYGE